MPTRDSNLCKAILDSGENGKLAINCLSWELVVLSESMSDKKLAKIEKFFAKTEKDGKELMESLK